VLRLHDVLFSYKQEIFEGFNKLEMACCRYNVLQKQASQHLLQIDCIASNILLEDKRFAAKQANLSQELAVSLFEEVHDLVFEPFQRACERENAFAEKFPSGTLGRTMATLRCFAHPAKQQE